MRLYLIILVCISSLHAMDNNEESCWNKHNWPTAYNKKQNALVSIKVLHTNLQSVYQTLELIPSAAHPHKSNVLNLLQHYIQHAHRLIATVEMADEHTRSAKLKDIDSFLGNFAIQQLSLKTMVILLEKETQIDLANLMNRLNIS